MLGSQHLRRGIVAILGLTVLAVFVSCERREPQAPSVSRLPPTRKLAGHSSLIEALAMSTDGKLALSGSRDETIRLWDLETGTEIRRFEGHMTDVQAVAFSADGKLIASGSGDRYAARDPNWPNDASVRVWDAVTGKQIHRFDGHRLEACKVVFSPDGKTLASGGADGLCILWNLETDREVFRLPVQKAPIASLVFRPDGAQILSATEAGELNLWDARSGQLIRSFGQDLIEVECAAFSADGKLIASGHNKTALAPSARAQGNIDPYPDCGVRIWEADTAKMLHHFAWKEFGPSDVAFSPDGDRVAAIMDLVRIWKLPSGEQIESLRVDGVRPALIRLPHQGFVALTDNVEIWYYRSDGKVK